MSEINNIHSTSFKMRHRCILSVFRTECPSFPLLPEVRVANFVHSLYSQNVQQALINNGLNHYQCTIVLSPCFCSIQQHRLDICVEQTDFVVLPLHYRFPPVSQNVKCCPCFADPCLYASLCPFSCVQYSRPTCLYECLNLFQCYSLHYN